MKKILVLDVESTTKAKGHPFHYENTLCYVGLSDGSNTHLYDIEYSGDPYHLALNEIKDKIESSDLLVGFNIKFDLHWIRRYIDDIKFPPVWDCQLAEFLLSKQTTPYPSLDSAATKYNLGTKLDTVATEYWDNGIDTPSVPKVILEEYLQQDLVLTHKLYLKQREHLRSSALFRLHCSDLLTLQEMEYNGMLYNTTLSKTKGDEYGAAIELLDGELKHLLASPTLNLSSSIHLSAALYGGTYRYFATVPTLRILKDGTEKAGTREGVIEVELPRLVDPLPRTETLPTSKYKGSELEYENKKRIAAKKLPYIRSYSVDKETLRTLKCKGKAKEVIGLLLRRSEMEKLQSTYFWGIPKIMEERGWKDNILHGQFNQCVAVTGRLSSTKPNLQNQSGDVKYLFESRYE
jgi:DNA polymerase I-like protein with 3'-5' exonuclease and polymerase domains